MESVDSPDDLPLTGEPLAAAQQKKKWWLWGAGLLLGLFVISKVVSSGGHEKAHGGTSAQHGSSSHARAATAAAAAAAIHKRMKRAAHSPLPSHLKPTTKKECRRTRIFPFHEGCPSLAHCRSRWSGVPPTAKLYGMPVWWHLGALDGLHDAAAIGAQTNKELRKDFHVEPHFVRDYVRLEDELGFNVNEVLKKRAHKLHEVVSRDLFVALGYLCCVEEGEIALAHSVLKRWVNTYNFKIALHFDRVECWHDHENSVSSMLVADAPSQRRLMVVNEAMAVALTGGAVPVIKSREMVMPFHFNLLGFRTADNTTIAPYLPAISEAVHRVNRGVDFKVTLNTDPQLGESFPIH